MSGHHDPMIHNTSIGPLDLVALVLGKLALEIEHIHKMKRETGPPAQNDCNYERTHGRLKSKYKEIYSFALFSYTIIIKYQHFMFTTEA